MKINLETKFNIGDKVFIKENKMDNMLISKCKECDGTGKIETKAGIRKCPFCDGNKGKYKRVFFHYVQEATIESLSIYSTDDYDMEMQIFYDIRNANGWHVEVDETDVFKCAKECKLSADINNTKEGWTDELLKLRDEKEEI